MLLGTLCVAAAGCDAGDEGGADLRPPAGPPALVGPGEGRLDLIAWAGLVEDGSSDPAVDWVTGFEERTGCDVRTRIASNAEEMLALVRSGEYDGVSASGDIALELARAGDVAPVDTSLVPNYDDVYEALREAPHYTLDGRTYGVPLGRGANLLVWRSDLVRPAPTSWGVVWDDRSPYRGRIAGLDNPLYIADAALWLKATRQELGIEDVFELDGRQFRAAVELLTRQREIVGEYWSDFVTLQAAFVTGRWVVGSGWQLVGDVLRADGVPVGAVLPREGSTGWSDTWMITSAARHPNCMYRWLDHVLAPGVNARIAEWFGHAPSNPKACALIADDRHCARYHADDEAWFARVELWRTPLRDCGDARGAVCKDYADWAAAWEEIEG